MPIQLPTVCAFVAALTVAARLTAVVIIVLRWHLRWRRWAPAKGWSSMTVSTLLLHFPALSIWHIRPDLGYRNPEWRNVAALWIWLVLRRSGDVNGFQPDPGYRN